jgi:hypothetical protein
MGLALGLVAPVWNFFLSDRYEVPSSSGINSWQKTLDLGGPGLN